jgi:hypothetical protein
MSAGRHSVDFHGESALHESCAGMLDTADQLLLSFFGDLTAADDAAIQ